MAVVKEFRAFLMRGNVIDLAVAVVIGAAFGGVVSALVKDLLTPFIAAIVGKPDFSAITFEINSSKFLVGDFINALLSFVFVFSFVLSVGGGPISSGIETSVSFPGDVTATRTYFAGGNPNG